MARSEVAKPTPSEPLAELGDDDTVFLDRLTGYVKYLYEEEKERRDVLNNTTKLFLATFAFVIGVGLVQLVAIDEAPALIRRLFNGTPTGKYIALAGSVFLVTAGGLFIASFISTILVVKMWKRERLCDPQRFVMRAMTIPDEARLLSAMVSDYVIAAHRNHLVNEKKARLLTKALFSFICAFSVFVLTWVFLQVAGVFWRQP